MKTNLSVNGQYSSTKVDDKAIIATDAKVASAISGAGNVSIRGSINTGPGGTGRPVRISGVEQWRIGADGLIEESKGQFDEADYQRQLSGAEAPYK